MYFVGKIATNFAAAQPRARRRRPRGRNRRGRTAGTPVGIFRNFERGVYDDLMAEQLHVAEETQGEGDLAALLHSGETWVVN